MYDVVAHFELLEFLKGQRHLASMSTFAAEIVLMEAVEDLVIGEDAYVQVVVDEAAMQCSIDGCEADVCFLVAEDALQAVGLLAAVGQDV